MKCISIILWLLCSCVKKDEIPTASFRVQLGQEPLILGSLRQELIDRVISKHLVEIAQCYNTQVLKDPTLQKRIFVKFVITKEGNLSRERDFVIAPRYSALHGCLEDIFRGMTFPKREKGIVITEYTLHFTNDKQK